MECRQCGGEAADHQVECEYCGTPFVTEPEPPPSSEPAWDGEGDGAQAAHRRGRLAMLMPLALLVAVICIGVAAMSWTPAPTTLVQAALTQLGDEFALRLDGSPLRALGELAGYLYDGEVTASVGYDDADTQIRMVTDAVLTAHGPNGYYELDAQIPYVNYELSGERVMPSVEQVPISLALSTEMAFVSAPPTEEEVYAFPRESFRSGVVDLLDQMGRDSTGLDLIASWLERMPDGNNVDEQLYLPYTQTIGAFFDGIKPTTAKETRWLGDRSELCTVVTYRASHTMLVALLDDLIAQLKVDWALRAQYNAVWSADTYAYALSASGYDAWLGQLRDLRDVLAQNTDLATAFTLVVDTQGRLAAASAALTAGAGQTAREYRLDFDFGRSVRGEWSVALTLPGQMYQIAVVWTWREPGTDTEHALSLNYVGYAESFSILNLSATWSKRNGALTLRYGSGQVQETITGALIADADSVTLRLDALPLAIGPTDLLIFATRREPVLMVVDRDSALSSIYIKKIPD